MVGKIKKASVVLAPLLVLQALWMFLFVYLYPRTVDWDIGCILDYAYALFLGHLHVLVELSPRIMDNPAGFLLSCQPLLITVYLWYKKPTWGRAFSMLCAWFFVGLFLVGAVLA